MRLACVGIENLAGYLAEGVTGWIQNGLEFDYIPQVTVQDFLQLRNQEPDRIAVLDVCEPGEVAAGVIENSLCIPLGKLGSKLAELDREKLLVVHCKSGYRSSIATSICFRDIANLIGGFDAWKTTGLSLIRSPLLPKTLIASSGR
jgi:rhodanese-related sulfurtransferase